MLDREECESLFRRKPVKRTHRPVVGAILVCSELHSKIGEGEEAVGVVKTFLILAVAAFDFAVMARRVGTNELVMDAQTSSSIFETGRNILFGV